MYSSDAKPSKAEVEERVMAVCKAFDRINADKVILKKH